MHEGRGYGGGEVEGGPSSPRPLCASGEKGDDTITGPLATYVERARQAGACESALKTISKLKSWDEFRAHPQAAEWSCWYAREVVHGPWPEGERTIAQDAGWAYSYARYVVQGRWPEGEPAIAKDAYWAYWYARDVLYARWPDGEPAIAQDAEWAYIYAFNVIHARWPEAELVIAQNAQWAYRYARGVI